MDDLLREFLTETNEALDVVDVELVRFEQDPTDDKILGNIFRLVHTIKGTCGFLGLPRLEAVAHAAETLMGKFRDGATVTSDAVSVILTAIDRIKTLVAELERLQAEPDGEDGDIISELEAMSLAADSAPQAAPAAPAVTTGSLVDQTLERPLRPGEVSLDELERAFRETAVDTAVTRGSLIDQTLERPLRPGEVSLDELERAFRETAVEAAPAPKPEPKPVAKAARPAKPAETADKADGDESAVKNQSIRVNVDTLETLMTMVSELVLTRNQLMEINRRNEDTEFKVPLQRLSNVTAELQEGVMKTRMQPIGNAWQKLPRIVRDLAGNWARPSNSRWSAPRPSSTVRCSSSSRTRSPTWSATPRTTGSSRPPTGCARASPRPARSGSPPIIRAATSSSRSPTTAKASTSSASRRRRSTTAS